MPRSALEADGQPGEVLIAVSHALASLTEPDRRLLLLRHQEHREFEEIGEKLNCSADEARRRWFQALERFSDALGNAP